MWRYLCSLSLIGSREALPLFLLQTLLAGSSLHLPSLLHGDGDLPCLAVVQTGAVLIEVVRLGRRAGADPDLRSGRGGRGGRVSKQRKEQSE